MYKIILSLAFCLSFILQIYSQETDKDAIIKEISEAAASIKTMQCDFVQTKHMKMLGNELVSKGEMSCSQPNKLRWEYLSPYTYTFILYNNEVILKKRERTDVIDVNSNKMFKEIANIMLNSVLGNCFSDKSFKVNIKSEDEQYIATLLPVKKEMKMIFSRITLHYDKKQAMVRVVELHEKNGDNTIITLTNVCKNEPIDENIYHVK